MTFTIRVGDKLSTDLGISDMLVNSSYRPPTSYLFIDGDNLRATLKSFSLRFFGDIDLPVDWSRVRGTHSKVFYYDAVPVKKFEESDFVYSERVAPKYAELATIERKPGFHVRSGDAVHRKRRGNEQKMVDVQLAVDALLMASRGLFKSVTLITGDLDFKPLVTALVEIGIDVHLKYPKNDTNKDLIAAADYADPIMITDCYAWLDPVFLLDYPQPTAQYNLQSMSLPRLPLVLEFTDNKFGICRIFRIGGEFRLIAERSGDLRSPHRLELAHGDAGFLRAYAEDMYSLSVPPFDSLD